MKKLTKDEILWIRACKSKNPTKRVESLYKRIYLYSKNENHTLHLAGIIAKIGEKHKLFNIIDVIDGIQRELYSKKSECYEKRCLLFFISKIRLSEISIYNGFIPLRRFREGKK